jgi:hypothetical protein
MVRLLCDQLVLSVLMQECASWQLFACASWQFSLCGSWLWLTVPAASSKYLWAKAGSGFTMSVLLICMLAI